MTFSGWLTIVLFVVILSTLAMPLGSYMAKVYGGERVFLSPLLAGPERLLYKILRVDPEREQDWKSYAKSLLDLLTCRVAAAVRDPAHAGRVLRSSRG